MQMADMFACSAAGCRPCGGAYPKADVIRVDVVGLSSSNCHEKSGSEPDVLAPRLAERAEYERLHIEEVEQREAEALEAAERQAAERRWQEETARQHRLWEEQEQRRLLEEERTRRQAEEAAREAERLALEEERLAREAALMKAQEEEEARRREEAELAERQRQQQAQADEEKLQKFFRLHNYKGVNEKRTTKWKAKYPLHTAVKYKDEDMVKVLLAAGADPSLLDSNNTTPVQVAQGLNKDGSFTPVVRLLREAMVSR